MMAQQGALLVNELSDSFINGYPDFSRPVVRKYVQHGFSEEPRFNL